MPKAFMDCTRSGRTRRVSGPNRRFGLKAGQYRNVCFAKGGKMHMGEVRHRKGKGRERSG